MKQIEKLSPFVKKIWVCFKYFEVHSSGWLFPKANETHPYQIKLKINRKSIVKHYDGLYLPLIVSDKR